VTIRDDLGPTFLPSFTTPEPEAAKTLDDGTPLTPEPAQPESSGSRLGVLLSRKPATPAVEATRTPISSGGSSRVGDPEGTAKVIAGLVSLAFGFAAGLLRQIGNGSTDVRRPTKDQTAGFAEPVAEILARHTDLSAMTPDLGDAILAGAAVNDYLTDGPIVVRRSSAKYLDEDQVDEPDSEPEYTTTGWTAEPEPADPTPTVTYL